MVLYSPENQRLAVEIRLIKYLNDVVNQANRKAYASIKEFHPASLTLNGIELIRLIREDQLKNKNDLCQAMADVFY